MIVIKIKVPSKEYELEVGTEGSTGFDIKAYLPEGSLNIPAKGFKAIPTGVYFDLPTWSNKDGGVGLDVQFRGRSGLAFKHGIICNFGTIDQDYRGEVKACLFNFSDKEYIINDKERIGQIIFSIALTPSAIKCKGNNIEMVYVDEILNDTQRGENGFGSTGK